MRQRAVPSATFPLHALVAAVPAEALRPLVWRSSSTDRARSQCCPGHLPVTFSHLPLLWKNNGIGLN
jgi:hypothetical protein